jgi:hypothetical protein
METPEPPQSLPVRYRALVLFGAYAGLRWSEAAGLTRGYSTRPETLDPVLVDELTVGVADPIEAMLFPGAPVEDDLVTKTGWWKQAKVADRMLVWVAVGMLMERTRMNNLDALAVLRGSAFTHQMTLDDVAVNLTGRNLPIDELVH